MQTRKFWCHYFASNGNDTRRSRIELTNLDWYHPFDNSACTNPIWYEFEDRFYAFYAQLTDDVVVYVGSLPDYAFEDDCYIENNVRRLTYWSDYNAYILNKSAWVSGVDIAALTEIQSPILNKAKQRRAELMAERQREDDEHRRKEELEREEERKREEQERIEEEKRLLQEEQKFKQGEYIDGGDLVEICRKYGLKVHLRTVHNLQQHVTQINGKGNLRYNMRYLKRKPSFDGCFKTAEELYQFLNNQ